MNEKIRKCKSDFVFLMLSFPSPVGVGVDCLESNSTDPRKYKPKWFSPRAMNGTTKHVKAQKS